MERKATEWHDIQPTASSVPEGMATLSVRESQVAFWLAQGKSNRDIGTILGISRRTAERHVENILRKLGLENRTSAAVMISAHRPSSL